MNLLDDLLQSSLGKVFTAASVEVRQRGAVLYRRAVGSLDPEGQLEGDFPRVTKVTPFDYASLTKLFTTAALFRLIDAGHITLDTRLSEILPEFSGPRPIAPYEHPLNPGEMVAVVAPTPQVMDAGAVRLRDLLTHSSGLPAWINLRKYPDIPSRLEACLTTPFAYPTGTQVVYSDVGYILLGAAIAKITDASLDVAMKRLVQKPLDLSIHYSPVQGAPPTEFCAWRGRRVVGEVHDENSATLGGVAGHAGLFGTATDCALLGQIYLADGGGFISPRLAREATRQHIGDRGLGWMMRTPGVSSSGAFFSPNSYGHTGFVGNSLWVDPERQLVCALLTNNVFFGRDKETILAFRPKFHDTLITALEGAPA
jgi:CubicO group peptidase (beta-lactamase class C family)